MPPTAKAPGQRQRVLWPRATALPAAGRPECNTKEEHAEVAQKPGLTHLAAVIGRDRVGTAGAPISTTASLRLRRGVEITPRDVALLQDLVRFYGLTRAQIHGRHFRAERTAANRLAALQSGGYVRLRRLSYSGPSVYVATELGARVAGLGIPAPRWSRLSIGHHVTVADVSRALLAAHPAASWIAERELRSAAMAAVRGRGGRLTDGVEHVPDGLLVPAARGARGKHPATPFATGGVAEGVDGAGGVAIEVELTAKSRAEYRRILGWYAAKLVYRRVAWYCATEAVRRRLDELVRAERAADFMTVGPLPAGVTVPSWD